MSTDNLLRALIDELGYDIGVEEVFHKYAYGAAMEKWVAYSAQTGCPERPSKKDWTTTEYKLTKREDNENT